jgi:putative hydrolase of HD superfamily
MNVKFLDAISTLFTLQRWNFVPRLETWVEAENVAYVAHLVYAVGRSSGLNTELLERALARALLQSFIKHFTSDISGYTKEAIKGVKEGLWREIQEDAANDTAALFPEELSEYIQQNLIRPLSDPDDEKLIESRLLRFVQMQVAKSECDTNKIVYADNPYYRELIGNLDDKVQGLRGVDDFRNSLIQLKKYAEYIKNMKYVRRWNQLNRSVETTVMSHTFVVAALALVTACIEASDPKKNLPKDFTYRSILRALFHDLPETFTGDIVTPSKRRIEKFANVAWPKIEQERLKPLTKGIPEILDKDISQLGLLDALPDADTDKDEVGKLVKDCDRLSLLLECVFERSAGRINEEMQTAFDTFAMNLLNSSWRSIREITLHRLHPTGKK